MSTLPHDNLLPGRSNQSDRGAVMLEQWKTRRSMRGPRTVLSKGRKEPASTSRFNGLNAGVRRSALVAVGVALTLTAAACGAGAAKPSILASGALKAPAFVYSNTGSFTEGTYNLFSSNFVGDGSLVLLPLATKTTSGSFVPQVASSWSLRGDKLVVNVRPHLVWQNGKPVTATDVVDSAYLAGVDGEAVWEDVSAVKATSLTRVVFTIIPGVSAYTLETNVLAMKVVYPPQYGSALKPGLGRLVAQYYSLSRRQPTAAPNSKLGKSLSNAEVSLLALRPKSIVGDGPFRLVRWNSAEASYVKSSTFFDASQIHVKQFVDAVYNDTATEGRLLSGTGQIAIDMAGLPYGVYLKELRLPHQHVYFPPSFGNKGLAFNNHRYPFSLVQVRQAIAYIIHRPSIISLVYGGSKYSYRFVQHPGLLYYANELRFLSRKQLDSLNSYPYNPSKAAKLLDSVGFHKRGGEWYLPDGKPFTTTITSTPFVNDISADKVFSGWLTAFGIKTTEVSLSATAQSAAADNGNYEMTQDYNEDVSPLELLAGFLGSGANFISGGANSGQQGLGFGPTMNVPGIGTVDVPDTITRQADSVSFGSGKMKALVWDWVRLVNREVPVVDYGYRRHAVQVSTRFYTDWPRQTSPLWSDLATYENPGLLLMLEGGYIRPRG